MEQITPICTLELWDDFLRQNNSVGRPRRTDADYDFYAQRIGDAITDISKAGPQLSRAFRLWEDCDPPMYTDDGEVVPEGYDFFVRRFGAWVEAIDDDDDAQGEQLARQMAVKSPYLTSNEATDYLRLPSVKALYSLVERVCGGKRKRKKYKFTKEELDMLLRGRNPWRKEK